MLSKRDAIRIRIINLRAVPIKTAITMPPNLEEILSVMVLFSWLKPVQLYAHDPLLLKERFDGFHFFIPLVQHRMPVGILPDSRVHGVAPLSMALSFPSAY